MVVVRQGKTREPYATASWQSTKASMQAFVKGENLSVQATL